MTESRLASQEVSMGQVAHIRYDGGALLLPAQDPYDWELVFEEAECRARRHGGASVQLGRKEMSISVSEASTSVVCAECQALLGLLVFIIDRQRFCPRCAKRYVESRTALPRSQSYSGRGIALARGDDADAR